ncbi:hypothetical protein D3C85_1632570 [compost metagenome]
MIGNIYNDNSSSAINLGCTFNPFDKLLEAFDKNEKLYERLVAVEREKVALLEKLLSERK